MISKIRISLIGSAFRAEALPGLSTRGLSLSSFGAVLLAMVLAGMAFWSTPADAAEPAEPVWSADMTVVEYTSVSIGAASADLFSNIGGSGNLRVKQLWSYTPDRELYMTFEEAVPNAADYTLQADDLSLEFPADGSGESSFEWDDIDVDWEDGQVVHVRIVLTAESDAPQANIPASGLPTISGMAQVGRTLTADTSGIADADGLSRFPYAYQWIRTDGGADADIADATDSTYTLADDDEGKTIRVRVTFNDDKGNRETLTGAATAEVGKSEPGPQFLVSNLGVGVGGSGGIQRALGAARSGFAQAFTTGTKTGGYPLGSVGIQVSDFSDGWTVGDHLQVTVNGVASEGGPGDAHCTLTSPSSFSTPGVSTFEAPTGAGSCPQLATETTYFVVIEWVNPSGTGSFALIPQTYPTQVSAATGEDPGGAEDWSIADQSYYLTVSSNARTWTAYDETASFKIKVKEANSPATGLPAISGAAQVGETLTADTSGIADADGLEDATFAYQWAAENTNIPGATDLSYTLVSGDEGKTVRVHVTFTDDRGHLETLTSEATARISVYDLHILDAPVGEHQAVLYRSTAILTPVDHIGNTHDSREDRTADFKVTGGPTVTLPALDRRQVGELAEAISATALTVSLTSIDGLRVGESIEIGADGGELMRIASVDSDNKAITIVERYKAHGESFVEPQAWPAATVVYHHRRARPERLPGYMSGSGEKPSFKNFRMSWQGVDVPYLAISVSFSGSHTELKDWRELLVYLRFRRADGEGRMVEGILPIGADGEMNLDHRQPGNPYTVREQHLRRYLGWPENLDSDPDASTKVSFVDDAQRLDRFISGPERTFLQEIVDWIYADDGHDLGRIYPVDDRYDADEAEALQASPETVSEALVRSYQVVLDVAFLDGTDPRIDAEQFSILTWERADVVDLGDASNTLASATHSGTVNRNGDEHDYYMITLGDQRDVHLELTDLSGEAGLVLEDASRSHLLASNERALQDELIATVLDAGVYYIRVGAKGSGTVAYTLRYRTALPVGNIPATGAPTIRGTARIGEILTADTSAIADGNGLDATAFSYQWLADSVDIQGATDNTYPLVAADVGKTIEVRVSFTDDGGNEETLTSAATAAVAYVDGPPGAPREVKALAGDTNLQVSWQPPADENKSPVEQYRIQYREEGGSNQELHTTRLSQQITDLTNGVTYEVQVTAKNAAGYGTPSDEMSETPDTLPPWSADMLVVEYTSVSIGATSADLFSNVRGSAGLQVKSLWSYKPDRELRLAFTEGVAGAEDLTLQVGDLTLEFPVGSSGDSNFRWKDVDVDWEDGQTLAVRIVPTSATVAPQPNRPATGLPTISGTAQVGETLTADTSGIADADGLTNAVFTYQWLADDSDIQGATNSTYTLADSDGGKAISVRVSFTDAAANQETLTSAATAEVAAKPNSPATGLPTISGTAQVGQTLTAETSGIADADGLSSATFAYQWLADDAAITGATSGGYTLVTADNGKTIKVRVTFTDDRGHEETLTSAPTETVGASGSHDRPYRLQATAAEAAITLTWQDPDTHASQGLYHILRHRPELGEAGPLVYVEYTSAPDRTFTDSAVEPGVLYVYAVKAVKDLLGHLGPASDSVEIRMPSGEGGETPETNSPATGSPTISGTAQVGETLSADTKGIADEDGLTHVSFTYQWMADDANIQGATYSTYTLTSSEQGQTVQVRVSFTDDEGNAESLTSDATAAVTAKSNTPATGAPTISGTAQVGETLTADTTGIADEDGLTHVSFTYQWMADDANIQGATYSTYTLTSSEQGQTVQVRVSFTDDEGNAESLTSDATAAVTAKPNTPATGAPTIGGTAQVGETLTAGTSDISDADGMDNATFTYQWVAGGSDISRATGSTYTLTASEQGQTVQVRVSFTDDAGNEESLSSEATGAVAAAPVPLTVRLTVAAPTSHDGSSAFTFEIRFSEEFAVSYKTLKFHAFTVTGGTVTKAQRMDKPSNIPWRITVQPDSNGDVRVALPVTTNCDDESAICTEDGWMLSSSLDFTVSGP